MNKYRKKINHSLFTVKDVKDSKTTIKKYYLDTSIWIDYFENRKDKFRPLGEWAYALLSLIRKQNDKMLVSDLVITELKKYMDEEKVKAILKDFKDPIIRTISNDKQSKEAIKIAKTRKIPKGDALHAIIAKDNNAILVARDHHFEELTDITISYKPEDLI